MKPDGTDVHVMARGLRGPVGLAFDDDGNLFTNDNDHESRADQYAPSRLLHVVPGIDFGWPRGWMASKSPDRYDLIEPVCDLGRGAPCDLTYYNRELLSDVCGDRLLMCRWDSYRVTAYRPEPKGTTFTAAEETIAVGDENCRPVGITSDREGRLYVTALYMTGNQAAPDCVSDLIVIERKGGDGAPVVATRRHENVASVPFRDDRHRQQLAIAELADRSPAGDLNRFSISTDEGLRLLAVLAIGRKLTVPDEHFVPPGDLELFYPKGSFFFHRLQRFYGDDKEIDLADTHLAGGGRIGSFTIAQLWAHGKHTDEQEALFAALVERLDDSSDRVRLQAAYYLWLLKDPRSEPLVEKTRREVQLKRLQTATHYQVEKAWTLLGGLGNDPASRDLLQGRVDLSARYGGRLKWEEEPVLAFVKTPKGVSSYRYFRVASGVRQRALLSVSGEHSFAWQNETPLTDAIYDETSTRWILDLQPGSNELLVLLPFDKKQLIAVSAASQLEITLPEKLDSSLLAERLRSASVGGVGQPVPVEFASVDWSAAARDGDAAEGRRLFGTLGCAKCHAVVPDQKSAGAPSLFEAKRRFTVPHLIESVLLPSRQVAEPFRAQTFVTTDGRTITGLVTGETAEAVELLMPDATRPTLYQKQIEDRAATQLSPMPQGLVKTPAELRHLLTYLLSEKPLPP
jgi:putative heme-binding domain-containing protein